MGDLTYDKVVRVGDSIVRETNGFTTNVLIAIGLGVLLISVLMYLELWMGKKGKKLLVEIIVFMGMSGLLLIGGGLVTTVLSSPEQQVAYNAALKKWDREYVTPYIDSLPTKKEKVVSVEYGYALEERGELSTHQEVLLRDHNENVTDPKTVVFAEDISSLTPVKVKLEGGETMSAWADVKPLAEGKASYIAYKRLDRKIGKWLKKGDYAFTLYTNEDF